MKKNILITGGAGYIGSVLAHELNKKKFNIFIIDNLENGSKQLIPSNCIFHKGDFSDKKILDKVFKNKIDLIIHLAAYVSVEQSIKNEKKYFNNNYTKFKKFIKLTNRKCKNLIFASTASVYKGQFGKLNENSPIKPKNPYAYSKLLSEKFIQNENKSLNYSILRFFNVVGSHTNQKAGLITNKPTHLIKKLCFNVLRKKLNFPIYGKNYPTKDGTAIRDYIHVMDLSCIIIDLMTKMFSENVCKIFNCGYGKGFSVKQVIKEFNEVSKNQALIIYKSRRKGDPSILVSNSKKIQRYLNWKPKYNKLNFIIDNCISWEKKIKKNGY